MKKNLIYSALLIMLVGFAVQATAQTTQKLSRPASIQKWIGTTFAKGKLPPFSFVYGQEHSSEFIRRWRHRIQEQPSEQGIVKYKVSYTDPKTGLRVDCLVKGFEEFGAVEWVLNFTNTGDENTPQIKQLKCVDYSVLSAAEGTYQVHRAMGSNHSRADFHPSVVDISQESPLRMAPVNGRSSDTSAFPFFNIISKDNKGIVVGIGWTGAWFADITSPKAKNLNLAIGQQRLDLYLYPKESIRTPLVALLFWQDEDSEYENYITGNNLFRRFILAHHTHKPTADYASYSPLCGGLDWGDPAPCNEYGCLTEEYAVALIKRYKLFGLKPEVIWLDAGWYEGAGGPNGIWWNSVGSWVVDRERFPRGLKPLSDAAHSIGAKFMVWFEPERVYDGSRLAREHPEWLLKVEAGNNLLDLGNKEALEWLCKYIGDFIEENGIDYYRQDFNMAITPYWERHDEPGRIGMKEIRHIEGLYAFWDYLLERFPQMMIDNCASGGRRIDLETTSRSIPLWRTDYQYSEVNGYQSHTYGLNYYLPLHGTGTYHIDAFGTRSSMSSATVCNWEFTGQRVTVPGMQNAMEQFRELRPYYMEDYYPLVGVADNTTNAAVLAYQLNRPKDDTGVVLAFRRSESQRDKLEVRLRGLKADAAYSLRNVDTGQVEVKSGKELMSGLTLTLPTPNSSLLIKYNIVK